ncbi:MAG: hypothetical protein JXR11_14325 [Balneola sp.]
MDGSTIKFVLNSQEREMIKNGKFDNYIGNTYALECHRGHWSEGRGSRIANRKDIIWNRNRNDCPDFLNVDYERDLSASIRVLELKDKINEKRSTRIFEIIILILGFFLTVVFADEIKNFILGIFN